jgi:cell division protein FtsB
MVVRRRLRAVLFPLALYCLSGAAGSYFLRHAVNDDRGLHVNEEYERQISSLRSKLEDKEQERQAWTRRIALLSGATIDRDLLDEEARARLGWVDKNDVIVILQPNAASGPIFFKRNPVGAVASATLEAGVGR